MVGEAGVEVEGGAGEGEVLGGQAWVEDQGTDQAQPLGNGDFTLRYMDFERPALGQRDFATHGADSH